MKTLYIERSTGECRSGDWVEKLDVEGVQRIVVGTGPGSFAGIRSALAFAQGYALGAKCEVLGLPSPCAIAADYFAATEQSNNRTIEQSNNRTIEQSNNRTIEQSNTSSVPLAVVGDARRGKFWIALFDGFKLICDVFQVEQDLLNLRVPLGIKVVSPDDKRIGPLLKETFGERYLGERLPTAEGLQRFAEANPAILKTEPLPIYLNPAVRD